MLRPFLSFALVACIVSLPASAFAGQLPQGSIVVAQAHGNGIILWDITASVASIVTSSSTSDEAVRSLELDAASILLDRLSQMSAASTVEVRVLYQKTPQASPIYRNDTFGGVERLLTVTATYDAAKRNKAAWSAQLSAKVLPSGITANVVGELPPQE